MRQLAIFLMGLAMFGCASADPDVTTTTTETQQTTPSASPPEPVSTPPASTADNPLLAPWSGPYGGVPPFDRIRVEHFQPALEAAMAENLAEVERIASNPEPATFQNTIAALEDSGRMLT